MLNQGEFVRVYGLDLSLAATGVACIATGSQPWVETLKPSPSLSRGCKRLDGLLKSVTLFLSAMRADEAALDPSAFTLVMLEGPLYNVPKLRTADGEREPSLRGYHERAGLWWMIAHRLWQRGIPFAVCSPNTLKLYATGKGNAPKDSVFASMVRRYPDVDDNNQADALVLALMGLHRLTGMSLLGDAQHRDRALAGVDWPDHDGSLGYAGPFAAAAFDPAERAS